MKYYLLDTIDRIQRYSKKLDAKTILYNREWIILNEGGDRMKFIFRPKGELIISESGKVSKGRWDVLSTDSILLDFANESFLYKTAFVDDAILMMQLDGNDGYLLFLNSSNSKLISACTTGNIEKYLMINYPDKNASDDDWNVWMGFLGLVGILVLIYLIVSAIQ